MNSNDGDSMAAQFPKCVDINVLVGKVGAAFYVEDLLWSQFAPNPNDEASLLVVPVADVMVYLRTVITELLTDALRHQDECVPLTESALLVMRVIELLREYDHIMFLPTTK